MTASVRKASGAPVRANRQFRLGTWVHNRGTKEHGMVRRGYEKDGATMYEVWLPATRNSLAWGYHVSDWAESVLELSGNGLPKSARLSNQM